jgi:two-component system NtrC family sensor kinase
MRPWSLRFKMIALVIGIVTGSSLVAGSVQGWLAFRALRDDTRRFAASLASDVAFGIILPQELTNHDLLAAEIRNIMAARQSILWLDIYALDRNQLKPVASSREPVPFWPHPLVIRSFAEDRTVTAASMETGQHQWIAAAPIRFSGRKAGVVTLAMSLEGANQLALSLNQQLLFVLIVAGVTTIASLALYTEYSINRPIRALLDTMAAVERGDLSVSPRVLKKDEMGQLAEGLTHMLRRIRETYEENTELLDQVRQFNQDLQSRVTEATNELANRNEALRRANEQLFDLQRQIGRTQRLSAIGQMTATFAHEIGTPLNSISIHLQLLARSPGLTEQDRQRLATIDGQIRRLVQTVQERLVLTGGAVRRQEPTDLNDIVRSITDLMSPVLAAKGIECDVAADSVHPKIRADGHQIQEVLLNLLTNAVDAMPTGGTLRIGTELESDAVLLRIADSGPGIPPEDCERIFEPFFTTKEPGKGSGLGLAVCRQIVQAHRGTIEATETPGGGATFEIRLPLDSGEVRR